MFQTIKDILPDSLVETLRPPYHWALSWFGSFWYGFPSRNIKIVAVTGTKGKSSVCEYVNSILETAGYRTALLSTIRFKIDGESNPNLMKMTVPGRFFVPAFIARAVKHKCDWLVLEMSSEAVKQFRNRHIALDALIFTNLAPEHIESHGSFANYVAAKLSIGEQLVKSPKRPRIMVANADDEYGSDFLSLPVDHALPFSIQNTAYTTDENSTNVPFEDVTLFAQHPGAFTAANILAAATFAHSIGIPTSVIRTGIDACAHIPGRAERIDVGQPYLAVVDYAHTPDSLTQLYEAYPERKKICVLGNCGGGRDTWKRPEMAHIAETHCVVVILTDEDPYDEDPEQIVKQMADGMTTPPEIIMDRRLAIRRALVLANQGKGNCVLVSGKGTDPYIMRAHGKRERWSDANVVREELERLHNQ